MARNSETSTGTSPAATKGAKSLEYAERGIRTSEDFANLMSHLMGDILKGDIKPEVANATINAGGKLLKVVEMQYKYGTPEVAKQHPVLELATGK